MTQKILAGRTDEASLSAELVQVKVDQVVLAREPNRVLGRAVELGLRKAAVEVAVAYPRRCVTWQGEGEAALRAPDAVPQQALDMGVLVARPGIGFAPTVHLERFGSPARLVLTDEPRMSAVGGAGMLTLPASASQLAEALRTGSTWVRPARSVQILLSGRTRPFVCVRDVALELVRRGLSEVVSRVDAQHKAPVVLEFAGPSARLLSVADRAVLCAMAPRLGAAGAIFLSDEKTEVYLRDQRRSKAHRGLSPDAGAPCDEVITIDLAAVDPLLMDETGKVRQVRELAGKRVAQALIGGDSGISLRDLLAAAALLKSKRVPAQLDFLLAPPSRQTLEVLARSGALVDLIATGARVVEPDHRVLTGELYPSPKDGESLRTCDPEPTNGVAATGIIASAETLAYAVATGEIGDPRSFKRPVRVTVPRNLPTDDVLLVRKGRSKSAGKKKADGPSSEHFDDAGAPPSWDQPTSLPLVAKRQPPSEPSALLAATLEDVRWAAHEAGSGSRFRAIIATHIPAATVSMLAGLGVLALQADEAALAALGAQERVTIPEPSGWANGEIELEGGRSPVRVVWLAVGAERKWTATGVLS
jgi:aconitate hydratase